MQLLKPYLCLLLMLLSSTVDCDDDTSTENNEIIPKEAIKNIDANVRQALLRAIDKLEKEAAEQYTSEEDASEDDEEPELTASVVELPTTSSSVDEILEESTKPDVAPTVQFFTATFDEKLSKEQPLLSFISKDTQLEKKLDSIVNLGSPDVVNNTGTIVPDNRQATRSIVSDRTNEISSEGKAEIQFQITKVKKKPVPTTTTTATTTSTTTTTPRPTHNEDGENIELVDKDDIKIQAAPLVTAFTVDLDERGAAKNVISILDRLATTRKPEEVQAASSVGPTIARLSVLPSGILLPTPLPAENVPQYRTNDAALLQTVKPTIDTRVPVSNSLRNDLALQQQQQQQHQQPSEFPLVNNYFIERQRALEQQIYQLQLQAKQQQEQISRQLQILEHQNHQRQQLPPHTILPPLSTSTTQKSSDPNSGFTIRPSLEFLPVSKPSNNFGFSSNQQLPIKEAPKFSGNSHNNLFNSNDFFASKVNNNGFGANNNGNVQFTQNGNPNIFGSNGAQRLQQQQSQQSSVQIQPSSQLSFVPNLSQSIVAHPPELSPFQNLPQNNYQVFQNLPFLSGNNNLVQQQHQQQQQLLQQQQLQQQQQQEQRSRQFRQESGTGNFGLNQLTANENQNFYRHQLTASNSNQLQNVAAAYQSALNHGINPYTPQNLRYQPGQAGF